MVNQQWVWPMVTLSALITLGSWRFGLLNSIPRVSTPTPSPTSSLMGQSTSEPATQATDLLSAPDLGLGLVGWWKMDESGGNQLTDSSGNWQVGQIQNGGLSGQTGYYANGIRLDGVDDYVLVEDTDQLDVQTGNFSLSVWTKRMGDTMGTRSAVHTFISKGKDTTYTYLMSGGGNFMFSTYDGGNNPTVTSKTKFELDTWYHIVGTYTKEDNETALKIYVNGVLESTGPRGGYTYASNTTSPVFMGEWANQPTTRGHLNGLLDEVRIYNRALSAEDVKFIHQVSDKVKLTDPDLKSRWCLNQEESQVVVDCAHKQPSGILLNGASINGAGSASLDGQNDYLDLGIGTKPKADFTLNLWLKPATAKTGGLIYKVAGLAPSRQDYYLLYQGGDGKGVEMGFSNGSQLEKLELGDANMIKVDKWQQLSLTKRGKIVQAYLNGELYTENNQKILQFDQVQHTSARIVVGRESLYPYRAYEGEIDDIQFYDRALTGMELLSLYRDGRN